MMIGHVLCHGCLMLSHRWEVFNSMSSPSLEQSLEEIHQMETENLQRAGEIPDSNLVNIGEKFVFLLAGWDCETCLPVPESLVNLSGGNYSATVSGDGKTVSFKHTQDAAAIGLNKKSSAATIKVSCAGILRRFCPDLDGIVSTLIGLIGCLIHSYSCSNFFVAISAVFVMQIFLVVTSSNARHLHKQLNFSRFQPPIGNLESHSCEIFSRSQAWRWVRQSIRAAFGTWKYSVCISIFVSDIEIDELSPGNFKN